MTLPVFTAITYLATAPVTPPSGGMDPVMVGTMLGSMLVALVGGGLIGKKVSDVTKTQVGPQPFIVDFKKEFITRAEHDVYRAEVRADFQRVEANFLRVSDKVETKHMELLLTIERAAKTGVDGRVALWNEIKPMGNEIAALKATSNVAQQLEKLGATLATINQSNNDGKTTR